MASVLFAWELGGGLGHLAPMVACAQELQRRGHRVSIAARDLSRCSRLLDLKSIALFQAPQQFRRTRRSVLPPRNLADIYANEAFSDASGTSARVDAWRQLFDFTAAEVVICDHSPTALLAARGQGRKLIAMGTGFFLPPDTSPWPSFESTADPEAEQRERHLVGLLNEILATRDLPELRSMSDLHSQCSHRTLLTFPELDHYGARASAEYWPIISHVRASPPPWHESWRPRVFAYLKRHPLTERLLVFLRTQPLDIAVVLDGGDSDYASRHSSERLRIVCHAIDLSRILPRVDFAILNGNYATTVDCLIAGTPCWQLPLTIEQQMLARRAAETGGCITSSPCVSPSWPDALRRLLEDPSITASAKAVQAKWAKMVGMRTVSDLADAWQL